MHGIILQIRYECDIYTGSIESINIVLLLCSAITANGLSSLSIHSTFINNSNECVLMLSFCVDNHRTTITPMLKAWNEILMLRLRQ